MPKKPIKRTKQQRHFSEAVRKAIVKEIDAGLSKAEASRKYEVSLAAIYNWLNRYSTQYTPSVRTIVEDKSEANKVLQLKADLKDAHAELGRAQIQLNFMNLLIETASKELGIDLKKNFDTKSSDSSKTQKP